MRKVSKRLIVRLITETQVASAPTLWAAQLLCRYACYAKVCFTCDVFDFAGIEEIHIRGRRRREQDGTH